MPWKLAACRSGDRPFHTCPVSWRVGGAVLLAVLAAFLYALSNVLELAEAEKVPDEYALRPGLVGRLIRRPIWLLGLLSDVGGYLAQAGALALAAVAFVEPILALGIVMALFLGAVISERRIQSGDWVAAIVLSAGLAMFLYEVSPTGGRDVAPTNGWLIGGTALAAVVFVCIGWATALRGPARAAVLGIAAGISFGASAVLTKALVHYLGDGVLAWAGHWEPYVLAITSIGGVIVAQSAFQTGALAASVGTTEAMGPITAAAPGFGLLDERLSVHGAAPLSAVVVSVAMILWAITALARAEERVLGPLGRPEQRSRE